MAPKSRTSDRLSLNGAVRSAWGSGPGALALGLAAGFSAMVPSRPLDAERAAGLARETETALGPPSDFRFAFSAEFPMKLAWMEMLRAEEGRKRLGGDRFGARDLYGHLGSWASRPRPT